LDTAPRAVFAAALGAPRALFAGFLAVFTAVARAALADRPLGLVEVLLMG
jgi:hypothetical protein